MSDIVIKDYSKSVLAGMKKAQLQALENYGKNWKEIVKRIVVEKNIVDTGALRDSFYTKINQDAMTITTATDVPYAQYQELGTWKIVARPFMVPSLREANGALVEILRQEIGETLGSTQGLTPEIKNL